MKIVLDTNVLVSGLLTPFGPNGEILRMIFSGELALCLDARILAEYKDVLLRPKFRFDKEHIDVLLDYMIQTSEIISSLPLQNRLPDSDDEPFLEAAIAGRVVSLVTGNHIHFPPSPFMGITIFSPSQFVEFYRKRGLYI